MNQETLRQLRAKEGEEGGGASGRKVSEVTAYRSVSEVDPGRDLVVKVRSLSCQPCTSTN